MVTALNRLLPLLIVALAGCVGAQMTAGDSCVTPDGKPGVCRLIRDCTVLYTLLDGRPTQENIIYLNRARCGFEGSQPVLCCPGAAAPPTPASKPPTPRPPTTSEQTSPIDVSNHPNVRLLPMDLCSPGGYDKIVGGDVADVFAYPWIARLGYRSRSRPTGPVTYLCGGSLVNDKYVLTAAHCVTNLRGDLQVVTVRLGEHTVDKPIDCRNNTNSSNACIPPPVDMDVEEPIPHPSYDRTQMVHDIALLRLRGRVRFYRGGFVAPVCLPVGAENQNLQLEGTKMIVAGWGTTETGLESNVLLEVAVPVLPFETCRNTYTQVQITRNQLCAGGEQGRDSCTGDSGGPLMINADVEGENKQVQFGVVSFGPKKCGTRGLPGIYTRVANYMDWLLDTMRP